MLSKPETSLLLREGKGEGHTHAHILSFIRNKFYSYSRKCKQSGQDINQRSHITVQSIKLNKTLHYITPRQEFIPKKINYRSYLHYNKIIQEQI